jgi:hypothetical protein
LARRGRAEKARQVGRPPKEAAPPGSQKTCQHPSHNQPGAFAIKVAVLPNANHPVAHD